MARATNPKHALIRKQLEGRETRIPTESEAQKLSASVVQTDSTNALRRLAEKEFEKRFSRCCAVVQEPIKVRKIALENSPFLKRVVEKINAEKPGAVEIIEEENENVASGTTEQQGKNEGDKTESKTVSNGVVQTKSTNEGD